MARFLNNHELILVTLIILLFDITGFFDIVVPAMNPNATNRSWFMIVLIFLFLGFDVFLYYTACNNTNIYPIDYAVEDDTVIDVNPSVCGRAKTKLKSDSMREADKLDKSCKVNSDLSHKLTKGVVLGILWALLAFVYIYSHQKHGDAPIGITFMYLFMLFGISLAIIAPFESK